MPVTIFTVTRSITSQVAPFALELVQFTPVAKDIPESREHVPLVFFLGLVNLFPKVTISSNDSRARLDLGGVLAAGKLIIGEIPLKTANQAVNFTCLFRIKVCCSLHVLVQKFH